MRGAGRHFVRAVVRDRSGAAAVEFAFIVSVLLALMSGAYDLSNVITARRDTQRIAVEMSQTLAACTTSPCVLGAGQLVMSKQANVFTAYATPTVSWAYVSRVGSAIVVSFGNMTYLQDDVLAAAKSALPGENDNGVCTVVSAQVTSIGLLKIWPSDSFGQQRYFVCTLQSKNVKVV